MHLGRHASAQDLSQACAETAEARVLRKIGEISGCEYQKMFYPRRNICSQCVRITAFAWNASSEALTGSTLGRDEFCRGLASGANG
jgi:hypothetical protein